MKTTTKPIRRAAVFGAGLILGLSFMSGVATAAPRTERTTTYTEDTDTNDGGTANNVVDDGDNAHPSGKDRSVEHGRSGNQGNAQHDPDDDGHGPDRSNGGLDQPDGPGGVDLADQDRNNGCGNDDDFEDDNEGWCGKPPAAASETPETPETPAGPEVKPDVKPEITPEVKPEVIPAETPAPTGTAVLGESVEAPAAPAAVAATTTPRPAQVLGLVIERPAAAAGAEVLGVQYERAPAALAMTGLGSTTVLVIAAAGLLIIGLGLRRMGASRA